MAAALASVFVIASLAHAKPQVAISFCLCLWSSLNISRLALASPPPPPRPPPWSRGYQTHAPPCLGAPASSPSSTTGRPTSSAHTQTRQLPGEEKSIESQDVLKCKFSGAPLPLTPTTRL